ncbi:RNase H domain-containing protein [Ditylenchus destructor]|uniref:ribonuclease H n=1 Tax=Ditylenchus destructor TaxID=166010 RepID=A0AAD4R3R1_9BILA|nr:RNase H domain-containing protein [Ditylenchus destructor]
MRPSSILLSSSTTLRHLPGSRPFELLSNMGDTSEDQKKGGRHRPVLGLSSADNQLSGVSARSKKIKKQKTDKQKEMKAIQDQQRKVSDSSNISLIEEWENANVELLTSGIPNVYVDGACKNNKLFKNARKNGSRVSRADRLKVKASYGVYWGEKHPLNLSRRLPYMKQTNNRAELAAAIEAIKQGLANQFPALIIFTDSNYVVSMFNEWLQKWKDRNWLRVTGERIVNLDLVKELDQLKSNPNINVQITHVPGHIGVPGNQKADQLAKEAISKNLVHEHPEAWPKDA